MARIIAPNPEWTISDEEVVTIALDKNEVVALVNACREYRARVNAHPTMGRSSLNAAGARVYEMLDPIKRMNGWN